MFEVYKDDDQTASASPQSAATEATPQAPSIKTKLVVSRNASEDTTLTPRLYFTSFMNLKAQIETLLRCLPSVQTLSLVSLQYRDADGDMVDLLPSTFDPEDFTGVPRVLLRAKVDAAPTAAPQGSKAADPGGLSNKTSQRCVLGPRDGNAQSSAALPSSALASKKARQHSVTKGTDAGRLGAKKTTSLRAAARTPSIKTPAPPVRPSPGSETRPNKSAKTKQSQTASDKSIHRHAASSRSPELVFGRKIGRPGTGNASTASSSSDTTVLSRPLPSPSAGANRPAKSQTGRRQRASAAPTAPKPSWNNFNQPAWEEAEKKAAAMRREARARILRKRAALSAKKEGGKAARIIARAKRDCRVTDPRRQKLGARFLHDPLGTPPPALGKRKLEAYKEFGRAAVAAMKFLPVSDGEQMPKRGRGCGEGTVVYPRGSTAAVAGFASSGIPANLGRSITSTSIAPKVRGTKRSAARLAKSESATHSGALLLGPPRARPGDIGSCSGIGFRMRPPSAPSLPRRRGGGGKLERGASALTAAAMAKAKSAPDPPAWSGRLRSSSPAWTPARKGGGGNGRCFAGKAEASAKASPAGDDEESAKNDAAAIAIMAKLTRGNGGLGGKKAGGVGEDVEVLQEQVTLLKAAAGLTDEELTWRMETAKPEANAYRIASVALERTETAYERLLWRQGQLQIALARLAGKGRGGDAATSNFLAAVARVTGGATDHRALSRLRSSAETVLVELPAPAPSSANSMGAATVLPADDAVRSIRAAAERMVKLATTVESTVRLSSEIDHAAVVGDATVEAETLASRAESIGRELRAVCLKAEETLGRVESWQQRRVEAPEFSAEEAAREEAWSSANREANLAALREMRALLPEAVWEMTAAEIQAAAAARRGSDEHFFYPSDLCVRLREYRPLHWLVSAPEDIVHANFLAGDGAASFTQLEGMDVTEMRALWCVLPREFSRDADGKKAEWRSRFRVQLEGLVRQQERDVIAAGWDPVRGRRATCRMPPLPAHRARHPAYFYPTEGAAEARAGRARQQQLRLDARKARLSTLEVEIAEAKSEVDSACADARSAELRKQYGAETLRKARETAKEVYSSLVRERKTLATSVAEAERTLSSTYPSLAQLESEAKAVARVISRCPAEQNPQEGRGDVAVRVPGSFSAEPELRRRTAAAARKLTPEEERAVRASEVQRAVSSRSALSQSGTTDVTTGVDGTNATTAIPRELGKKKAAVVVSAASDLSTGVKGEAAEGRPRPQPGRVQVAPAVLAFLEKDCRDRTAKVEEGEERIARGAASAGVAADSAPPREPVAVDGLAKITPLEGNSLVAPPAKPISKSLAALIARGKGDGQIGAVGSSRNKASAPAFGFLDELKKRAGSTRRPSQEFDAVVDKEVGSRESKDCCDNNVDGESSHRAGSGIVGIGTRPSGSKGLLAAGPPVSFLDELKARRAVID